MSTACLTHPIHAGNHGQPAVSSLPAWHVGVAAFVIGLIFFLTEHNVRLSLAEAYTQTAEEMEITAQGGNALRRVAFFILAGQGVWLLAMGKERLRINLWLAAPVAGYLLLAVASLAWSTDPSLCLRRLTILACCVVGATGMARRFSLHELCWVMVAAIAPLVLTGVAAELCLGTFRPWSSDYRFSGTVHPNTQGMYLTALALAALALARAGTKWRWQLIAVSAASLVLLVLTKSRTGTAASLTAIACVFLVQSPWQRKLGLGLASVWLGLVAVWLVMICGYDPLTDFRDALLLGRADESDALSGRAYIWPLVTSFIARRPWLGYGYESFWTPAHIDLVSGDLEWGVREAHNGYLEILLSTGIVGLTLALLSVAAALLVTVGASTRRREPAYTLPLGMLVFGLLSSWMESGHGGNCQAAPLCQRLLPDAAGIV